MSDNSLLILAFGGAELMARRLRTNPRKICLSEAFALTVNALLEATARILVREGFDKASTNHIAEVAGVSVGSLYQYFPARRRSLLPSSIAIIRKSCGPFEANWQRP